MAKEIEEKIDVLGQPIVLGCHLAVPAGNLLKICKVVKITNKMIHVESVKTSGWKDKFMVYPHNAVRLDGPDVLAYILKG